MTANNSEIKEPIRGFILEYAAGHGVTEVNDDTALLKTNVIDSLGVFRLIDFLEETFPLTIDDTDMVPENFETHNDIEKLVGGKINSVPAETTPSEPTKVAEPERELVPA